MLEPVTFISWSTDAAPLHPGPCPRESYVHCGTDSVTAAIQHPSRLDVNATPTPPASSATTAESPPTPVASRASIPIFWPAPVQAALAVLILVAAAALSFQAFRSAPPPTQADAEFDPIDLNLASEAELRLLPGVGPKLARRIVEYRQQHGNFRSVDDLQAVFGVGPAVLARLRPRVTVAQDAAAELESARPRQRSAAAPSQAAKMSRVETARSAEVMVDVNHADAGELRKIPGVGPVLSRNIIDYRTHNGPFRTVEELCKVPGIKSKTLEKLRPFITVDAEASTHFASP